MAISKTDFINYTRCPRYVALENVYQEKLEAEISYDEYKEKEFFEQLNELVGQMYEEGEDGESVDLIKVRNKQLEAMMEYYKRVETEAGRISTKYFGGKSTYAESTFNQECFDFNKNGIRYMCYVDIYNESDGNINIIEVKATTDSKYKKMVSNHKKGEKFSIWERINNINYLKGELKDYPLEDEMPIENYAKQREKLFDRFGFGRYIYDLAVQRFMIEGEYNSSNNPNVDKIHYYLAVLNSEYIFDGTYEDGKAVYNQDESGNELITFFDLTEVTKEYQRYVLADAENLERYLKNLEARPCKLGKCCNYKQQVECKFFKRICGANIPQKNSSLSYVHNGFGFEIAPKERLKGLDLINEGYIDMLDIPEEWIKNPNHFIQRECYQFDKQYYNKEKIKAGLKALEYPIYHLDFETFPCPVPRYKGEWPYIQSPFEFSLHIEHEPGVCDKDKDNYVYLATSHEDEREELIKMLIKYIDGTKGTLFAQNVAFEKGRIKELAKMFPEYSKDLMKIHARGFDLLWLVNTNSELYQDLGYSKEEASICNFYDKYLSGSYSIKKTLPVFSDLSYANLKVKNGTEAIVEYANYPKMSKEEYKIKYQALIDYCKQDTWAMVVILDALRNFVK